MKAKLYLIILAILPITGIGQNPQGLFLNDFEHKTFVAPQATASTKTDKATTITVTVNFSDVITPVSKYLFGNNVNIWMTQIVDQPALMNNITKLKPNIIRFPGGSISGIYFWDAEKDQPPADAPQQIWDGNNTFKAAGYWYGKNSEGWTLSLENYYKMLQQTGNTGMITVNYDYARYSTAQDPVASAAHHAAEWVRHDNGRTRFWEVGNESNGIWQPAYKINQSLNHDGQSLLMSGELYGKHFKVFADSMRKAAADIGKTIYIGAQLLEKTPESWQTGTDKNWNTGVLQHAGSTPDYYIIHSYYTAYQTNAGAAEILATATSGTQNMMTYVNQNLTAAGVTKKPLALTEYNIFSAGSKQQASFINGMHTTIVLAELIKNKYGMAARWDLANAWDNGNDHGIFSQGDDGTTKWTPRAAFYYMYYFQKCFGDYMVGSTVSGNSDVLAYPSKFNSGEAGIVLVNKSTTEQIATVNMNAFGYGDSYYVYSLTGGADNGEFSLKVSVNGNPPTQAIGGPSFFESIKAWSYSTTGGIKVRLPARSVQFVMVEAGNNVITAVDEEEVAIKVSPNPSNGIFSVMLNIEEESRLFVVDLNGREVISQNVYPDQSKIAIDSKLSSGLYLLEVKGKSKTSFAKIMIK
jgi:hypothetical protein